MGKIKYGGYIFISWIGDHGYHVHVYKDKKQVLKWDLKLDKIMEGQITKRIKKLINELKEKGLL